VLTCSCRPGAADWLILAIQTLKAKSWRASIGWCLALKVQACEGEGAGKSLSEMWTDRLRFQRSTVLLVEPDPVTRQLLSRSLRPAYQILQAASAEEAVRIAARHKKHIDLLLTEVQLPQLAGGELLELLALDYPKLKVVFVSKSIDPGIRSHTRRQTVLLLEHPFRDSCLQQAVREVLETPESNRVEMKWRTPSFLQRMRSYFRRRSWLHRTTW